MKELVEDQNVFLEKIVAYIPWHTADDDGGGGEPFFLKSQTINYTINKYILSLRLLLKLGQTLNGVRITADAFVLGRPGASCSDENRVDTDVFK